METFNEKKAPTLIFCPFCRLGSYDKLHMKQHIMTCTMVRKHDLSPNNNNKYYCNNCDYYCSKQSDLIKHFLTSKHQRKQNGNKTRQNNVPTSMCIFCKKFLK